MAKPILVGSANIVRPNSAWAIKFQAQHHVEMPPRAQNEANPDVLGLARFDYYP